VMEMRIAHVCPRYHPFIGGVETHVRMICERLVKRGYEVEVLCTDPSKDLKQSEEVNGVLVRRFMSWAPDEAYYFSPLLDSYLRENSSRYAIVHAHGYQALPALSASRAKTSNLLFFTPHYHGRSHALFRSLLLRPYKLFGRRIFEKADMVISVSRYEKTLIQRDFKVEDERIKIIPNGVVLKEFEEVSRTIGSHNKMLLSVGRLEKYKGMQYLIQLLQYLDVDYTLRIIGKGPYLNELDELVDSLQMKDKVEIKGGLSRHELLQSYADADVFALLSTNEAYGISVAEAIASGTPCIVADESGLSEWIDDENCLGIKMPPDMEELVYMIKSLVGKRVKNVKVPDWDDVTGMLLETYFEKINES
jgi:glycosyltransferase involved in cell wall biosynthesis